MWKIINLSLILIFLNVQLCYADSKFVEINTATGKRSVSLVGPDNTVVDGDVAGGDLNGNYPSPQVSDDSHNHIIGNIDTMTKSQLEGQISDAADLAEADGEVYTGTHDFGGADTEMPQASPAAPATDGGYELDMTDGKLVIQNSSSHADISSSTDAVYGSLLKIGCTTAIEPDTVQGIRDNVIIFPIESTVFPHGIVIVRGRLILSEDATVVVNVEKWIDSQDGAPDTLFNIATSTSDEASCDASTCTNGTFTTGVVGAGELLMMDLDGTNVAWQQICVEFYEPVS